jgi:hypothetical protein
MPDAVSGASCNDRGISLTTELAENHAVEKLPASSSFLAVRLALSAALIPLFWLWLGAPAGEITAAALAAIVLSFFPRALVLDEEGFRVLSLVPRKKVLWNAVDSFSTGYMPRSGPLVVYAKAGRKPRWWYPAGWPAQGSIPAAFASRRRDRALSATDLCNLLNNRLARAQCS